MQRADLEDVAKEVGLDMGRFRSALDSRTHRAVVEAELQRFRELGVAGHLPAFFVNGWYKDGRVYLNYLEERVELLRLAIASGVPLGEIAPPKPGSNAQ